MQDSFNSNKDPRSSWKNQDFTVGRIKDAFNANKFAEAMHQCDAQFIARNIGELKGSNSTTKEVLGWAMGRNYTDIVETLFKQSPELVNKKRMFGMTPAMDAAHSGNPDMMKLVIAAGADLTATNVNGLNALDYAIDRNNQECIGLIKAALPQSAVTPAVEAEMPESMVLIVVLPKQKFGG
jgi:ankyrin repeat protein